MNSKSLSTVKAEIKDWERAFKSSNGKDPTIEDIKLQPHIASKYKLYKKLSKAAAQGPTQPVPSTSANPISDLPSTPPTSRTRVSVSQPSLLLSKPRVAHTTAPLSTFNPFSPQKNKGKQREASIIPVESRLNPFTTSPSKTSSKRAAPPLPLSSDPFPTLLLQRPSEPTNTPPRLPPVQTSAISRARKRLRGEPVSPSPNKEKRRRVGPQSTLPFTTLAPDSSDDGDGDGDVDMDTYFVTDSPVKQTVGIKSFKLLFDETSGPTQTGLFNERTSLGRTKSTNRPGTLFGTVPSGNIDEDMDMEWNMADGGSGEKKNKRALNNSFLVKKKPDQSSDMKISSNVVHPAKRSLPHVEPEFAGKEKEAPGEQRTGSSTSPPPVDVVKPDLTKNRGKAKGKSNIRKKAKISTTHEESDEELNIPVKVIDRSGIRQFRQFPHGGENDFGLGMDDIPGYIRRVSQADTLPSADIGPESIEDLGKFEVELPEKLRRVLALESVDAKARDSREEQVFKGLLYGYRSSHYDPIKGGNIWDVGEDDSRVDRDGEVIRDTEGEDDWEGEPVPWEVGEL